VSCLISSGAQHLGFGFLFAVENLRDVRQADDQRFNKKFAVMIEG
jgi:hypothetical protein